MRIFLTACASLLLTGCVTPMVQSTASSTGTPPNTRLLGEYGVAQSVFTLTISAGGGDAAKNDDAKTSTVVVTNTVNVPPLPDKPKSDEAVKAPASETAWCDSVRKSYNTDRVATLAFAQRHGVFLAKLQNWITQGTYSPEEQKDILKAVDEYVTADRANTEALSRAKGNIILMAQDRNGGVTNHLPLCPQRFKVDIKESVELSRDKVYRLYANVDDTSADHWVAEFDGGFPKNISGTADSKVGEVAVAAAKSIGTIEALGVGPSLPMKVVAGRDDDALAAALKAVHRKILKPDALQQILDAIAPKPETLDPIDVDLPIVKTYVLEDLESDVVFPHDSLPIAIATLCASAPVKSEGTPVLGVAVSSSRACELRVLASQDYAEVKSGADPTARLTAASRATNHVQMRAKVWALDSRYVATLPLDRTVMIKTTTSYAFAGGRVTKSEFDRPAPAMEVVSFPFKLIGGFAGAFLDGVKGKTSQVQARTDLTKAHTAEIEAATAYDKAKKAAVPSLANDIPAT